MTILITGASGNVGREIVQLLKARGAKFRVAVRPGLKADAPSASPTVPLHFLQPESFGPAVHGCDTVFLMRPPPLSDMQKTLNPFIDVARREGVQQIVFLSVAASGSSRRVPHFAVEERLRREPRGWTILRPGFFAQNFGGAYRLDVLEDDRIYVPAGRGRVAFIDVRDIAAVAVQALLTPAAHDGKTYILTGPQAVSFDEAATLLTRTLGRDIRYAPASIVGYMRHLHRRGLPWKQLLVQTVLHVGLRYGQAASVDPTLVSLLGHSPRTLGGYFQDSVDLWRASAPVV